MGSLATRRVVRRLRRVERHYLDVSEPVVWKREAHTETKHELLRAFFTKWVSVHSEWFAKRRGGTVRVYDGFAGPGVYKGGEPGSPVILLESLLDNPRLLERWQAVCYDFHFVEKHPGRAAKLRGQLGALEARARSEGRWSEQISWTVTCGRYEDHVPEQPAAGNTALFLFLDPFGYSHAPMTLTRELIQQPKSDTLIFLPLSFVNRFRGRSGQETAMDRFFGTREWRDVPDGPGRPAKLLELFEAQLKRGGLGLVSGFQLRPEGSNEYWIVGASDHLQGYASIKEGFWAADPENGRSFATQPAPPPGQQALAFDTSLKPLPNTAPLLELLRETFGSRSFTVEEAQDVTRRSRFLESHLKRMTLAKAEAVGQIEVKRPAGARQFKEGKRITLRFL
jgi:three-Cys-motif partner protein